MELQELSDDTFGFQANGARVGAKISVAEDTLWPA